MAHGSHGFRFSFWQLVEHDFLLLFAQAYVVTVAGLRLMHPQVLGPNKRDARASKRLERDEMRGFPWCDAIDLTGPILNGGASKPQPFLKFPMVLAVAECSHAINLSISSRIR